MSSNIFKQNVRRAATFDVMELIHEVLIREQISAKSLIEDGLIAAIQLLLLC